MFVSALGTGTIALMLRSTWLLHWLNHGHQLTAIAAYRYEANASSGAAVYLFMLIWFPVIGLIMSALGVTCAALGRRARRADSGPRHACVTTAQRPERPSVPASVPRSAPWRPCAARCWETGPPRRRLASRSTAIR